MDAGFLMGGGVGLDEAAFRAESREGRGGGEGADGSFAISEGALVLTRATAGFGSSLGGSFVSFDSFVSFPRCFLSTSWRCLSRAFSSRRRSRASRMADQRSRAICESDAKRRPNENCVDRMMAANSSVRIRMIDPVRLRYSASNAARRSPRAPQARNSLPPTASVPNATDRQEDE